MKKLKAPLVLWLLAAFAVPLDAITAPALGQTSEHSCPTDQSLSDLVAGSDLVFVGRLDMPPEQFAEEIQREPPRYIEIPISIIDAVKGGQAGRVTVRFYTRDASYQPAKATVLALANAPALFFVTRIDEGATGLYFAGGSPAALGPASESNIVAVRAEVARQVRVLESWQANPSLPHYEEVRRLIARLGRVQGNGQQQVFDRLEALGHAAVPAIIAQMDVRRPLRTRAIRLSNRTPDAFEDVRQYGPILVVDGLAAVLNQMTGASFGDIENGGSDRQRSAAVAGWRVYANDLRCRPNTR